MCEAQIQKMLNKGVLKNVMSRGAKSSMLVKNGDVVNVEKQKEIKENNEEQLKEKQETSIENPRSRRAQEKPEKVESPSNMDEALNVGKSDVKDIDGTSDSQYTTAVNKMNDKAEVLTVTSNHVRETSQNQVWSSIRGLTDSLTKTNELLQKEREYSRKLEKEISDLKMRLFEQEMKTTISKDNEDSLWTESNAGLRATKHHIAGRLATNIEFVDSSSSLSSDEEDMNEWTTQCTGKREAPRKQAAQEKATKKQPNKGSAQNFNNNFKKSATHSKIKRKDSNQQRRKTDSNNAIENERNQLKVTIVGDSQVNRLDEMKLCNDSRKVEKRAKGGMKIKDVVNKVGVCNGDVIIVHAGTCDIKA